MKTLFQVKDISMSGDQLEGFLFQGRILRLASKGSEDLHVVPIWYLYENGKIYIQTAANSLKVKDMKGNSEVAMCVDVGDFYYDLKNVRMLGRGTILKDRVLTKSIAEKIQVKYLGSTSHPQAKEYLSADQVVVEIEILKKYSEDYSRLE